MRLSLSLAIAAFVAACAGTMPQPGQSGVLPYDVIVRNGTVLDGRKSVV